MTHSTDDTWTMLTKYKLLQEQVRDLRTRAWMELPPSDDIEESLQEAEAELEKLKIWIDLNFEAKRLD